MAGVYLYHRAQLLRPAGKGFYIALHIFARMGKNIYPVFFRRGKQRLRRQLRFAFVQACGLHGALQQKPVPRHNALVIRQQKHIEHAPVLWRIAFAKAGQVAFKAEQNLYIPRVNACKALRLLPKPRQLFAAHAVKNVPACVLRYGYAFKPAAYPCTDYILRRALAVRKIGMRMQVAQIASHAHFLFLLPDMLMPRKRATSVIKSVLSVIVDIEFSSLNGTLAEPMCDAVKK